MLNSLQNTGIEMGLGKMCTVKKKTNGFVRSVQVMSFNFGDDNSDNKHLWMKVY